MICDVKIIKYYKTHVDVVKTASFDCNFDYSEFKIITERTYFRISFKITKRLCQTYIRVYFKVFVFVYKSVLESITNYR